jgi:aminoglycoside phosphotransferase (APT) family kinase protein
VVALADDADIAVKVYLDADALRGEAAALARAHAAAVPVPEVLRFEPGPPAVLVTRLVRGVPLSSRWPDAAHEAGRALRRLHDAGGSPPFSGGQDDWTAFVDWWADREIAACRERGALDGRTAAALRDRFDALRPALAHRPVALLHGDLQAEHVLVDPATGRLAAILDLVDVQPGDPLLDVAVLSLWDEPLAEPVLAGHGDGDGPDAGHLLAAYRLLRHLAGVPWLLDHGLTREADRSLRAIARGA